jgi:hypothetical protein
MLRLARGAHEGDKVKKSKSSAVKKHKLKLKMKKPQHLVPAVAAAGAAAAAAKVFGASSSAPAPTLAISKPAFEDESKEALLRKILSGAVSGGSSGMIAADTHRLNMNQLREKNSKRKSLPRYLRT